MSGTAVGVPGVDSNAAGKQFGEAGDTSAGRDRVAADPGRNGCGECAVQLSTVDRQLRPLVACGAATGFAPDQLSVPVVEDQFAGGHGAGGQLVEQAQFVEFANGIGQQVQADPEGFDARRGFQYRYVLESCGVQAQCCGQPADPGTRDDYVHALPCPGVANAAEWGVCHCAGWLSST